MYGKACITPEFLRLWAIITLRARKQYAAACRALSICNRLKNPAQRKKHASRIFSAMNKLRAI